MSLLYKLLIEQRKKQKKNRTTRNINRNVNGIGNGNGNPKYVCHACKSHIEEYETFWFLDKTYCVLCYVLLTT